MLVVRWTKKQCRSLKRYCVLCCWELGVSLATADGWRNRSPRHAMRRNRPLSRGSCGYVWTTVRSCPSELRRVVVGSLQVQNTVGMLFSVENAPVTGVEVRNRDTKS